MRNLKNQREAKKLLEGVEDASPLEVSEVRKVVEAAVVVANNKELVEKALKELEVIDLSQEEEFKPPTPPRADIALFSKTAEMTTSTALEDLSQETQYGHVGNEDVTTMDPKHSDKTNTGSYRPPLEPRNSSRVRPRADEFEGRLKEGASAKTIILSEQLAGLYQKQAMGKHDPRKVSTEINAKRAEFRQSEIEDDLARQVQQQQAGRSAGTPKRRRFSPVDLDADN